MNPILRYGLDAACAAGDLAAAQLGAVGWCLYRNEQRASIQLFFSEQFPSPLISLPGAVMDEIDSGDDRVERVRVPFGAYELVSVRILPRLPQPSNPENRA